MALKDLVRRGPAPKPKMKKKAARTTRLRFRKRDPYHNLLAAAQHFILANGGTAVVIGGAGVQRETEYKYRLSVGVVGRPPQNKSSPTED